MGKTTTRSDKVYLAGLFDGEGCIHIDRWSGNPCKYQLLVQVKMCDGRLLKEIHEKFGGNLRIERRSLQNPKHSDIAIWRVGGLKAKAVLEMILPYLRLKRKQAELGIAFQNSIPTDRGRTKPSQEELDYREACYKRMRELKYLERTYRLL